MPIITPCAQPGCPATATKRGRCDKHALQLERSRGSRQKRGYDSRHDQLRRGYQRQMNDGIRFTCWRCGRPIDPTDWMLGHCDVDRRRYHGPECPPCNLAVAGRRGCPHPSHRADPSPKRT